MDPTLATTLAQFGVAGLIGWMWLTERRAAESRDQQLTEAHTQLAQDRTTITILLKALEDNTKAITTLESTQRMLIETMNRPSGSSPSGGGMFMRSTNAVGAEGQHNTSPHLPSPRPG